MVGLYEDIQMLFFVEEESCGMIRYEIKLENSYEHLESAHLQATAFFKSQGLPPDITRAANLGLDEVITNILKYGYDDEREHQISVTILVEESVLTMMVMDDGRAFDPLRHAGIDVNIPLKERRPGCLGIHLIRELFDEVSYRRENEKNYLTMQKRIVRMV